MKLKYILAICFGVSCLTSIANKMDVKVLTEELTQGRVLDVYERLEKADPQNQDVNIFLTKLNLALNLYAVQIQYEKFGFVNLQSHQTMEDVRGKVGTYTLFSLPAYHILDSLIVVHPNDSRLYKALSDYYYESYLNYSEDMPFTPEELLQKLENPTRKAMDMGSADFETYFIYGFLLLKKGKYEDALKYLQKSYLLNDQYGPNLYNLSYAEFALKNYRQSILNAQKAFYIYSDPSQKTDALRMVSYGYEMLGKTDSAVYFLQKGLQLTPTNQQVLEDYLYLAVRHHLPEQNELVKKILSLNPQSPEGFNLVINAYHQENGDYKSLLKLLEDLERKYPDDAKALANINFYEGQLLFQDSVSQAKVKFKKSKLYFSQIYPATHPIFGIIQDYLDVPEIQLQR